MNELMAKGMRTHPISRNSISTSQNLDFCKFGHLDSWISGYLDIWILVTSNLLLHPHSEILCGAALPYVFFKNKHVPGVLQPKAVTAWCNCDLSRFDANKAYGVLINRVLSPATNNYDYVNYVSNTQSNNYPSTMLISGVQEVLDSHS